MLDLALKNLSNKMKQIHAYSKRKDATTSQAFSALPTSSFTDNSSRLQRVATRAHTILRHGSLYAVFPHSMRADGVTARLSSFNQCMQNDARSRESV